MKVICISDCFTYTDGTEPRFGEVVSASQCPVYDDSYDLLEYPKNKLGKMQSFQKKHFAPISDISETEFEREYNRVTNLK